MIIIVPTGAKSSYVFKLSPIAPDHPQVENEGGHHYHTFDGRDAMAVKRLMEECQKYKDFFDAMKLLSNVEDRNHSFQGFLDESDVEYRDEPGEAEAWELVGQMLEEASRAEEVRQ